MPIRIESVAHGGDGIGRAAGKVVFVRGAVPGDLVEVEIVESRPRFDRAASRYSPAWNSPKPGSSGRRSKRRASGSWPK